jgi:UDP-N-acetylglucosamine 2-epimerase
VVVLQHPVTTEYNASRAQITETLNAIRDGQYPTLWLWPNVDAGSDGTSKGIRAFRENHPLRRVHFYKNMAPLDFLSVLINSRCIVGNSSVAIRECAYLGVPAVNIGSRQQGRDRGRNVIDVDYDRAAIQAAIDRHWAADERVSDSIYGEGDAGRRIADVLATAEVGIEKRLTY